MARKLVERSLPALEKLFSDFHGLPKKAHQLHLVTEHMHSAARRLRKTNDQPFYSMREASQFLLAPLRTVALAYQQLENQGLIVRVRGSRTILLGKVRRPHRAAQCVVSVPIAHVSVINSVFTRSFCYRISEELSRHNFVANLFFFKAAEASSTQFAARLKKQADIAIWLFPDRCLKETILMVRDHGVQNVILRPIEDPFLPADYLMDWTTAYQKVIRGWKEDGIRYVVVAKASKPCFQPVVDSFLHLLREGDCTFMLAEPNPVDLCDKVEQALKTNNGVACALLEHGITQQMCNYESAAMARLTTRCRVLFGRGVVQVPPFFNGDFRADVVGFLGDEVATRVASDLARRSKSRQELVRLVPRWMPHVSLVETLS
jgi:hypothetical protein